MIFARRDASVVRLSVHRISSTDTKYTDSIRPCAVYACGCEARSWCGAVRRSVVWCGAVSCRVVWCRVVCCGVLKRVPGQCPD